MVSSGIQDKWRRSPSKQHTPRLLSVKEFSLYFSIRLHCHHSKQVSFHRWCKRSQPLQEIQDTTWRQSPIISMFPTSVFLTQAYGFLLSVLPSLFTRYSPFSMNKPSSELVPGPPLSHSRTGVSAVDVAESYILKAR